MTISPVHCRVKDLIGAVEWFTSRCGVLLSFSDAGMAVLLFGAFTLILDARPRIQWPQSASTALIAMPTSLL